VLHDQNREKWDVGTYVPLQNVLDKQAPFTVIDSVLSEEACSASSTVFQRRAHALVIWEASSATSQRRPGCDRPVHRVGRSQVGRQSGLVLMLPHATKAGSGTFVRAAGNASCSCRPTTTCRSCSRPRGADIPPAAAPDDPDVPQAPGDHVAQILLRHKDAASELVTLARGEFRTVIPDASLSDLRKCGVRSCVRASVLRAEDRARENERPTIRR